MVRVMVAFVAAAVAGGVVRAVAGNDDRPLTGAEVGECLELDLDMAAIGEVFTYDRRSCDEPHAFEVIARQTLPGAKGSPYPGVDALEAYGQEQCDVEFAGYVGIEPAASELVVAPLYAGPDSWDEGNRGLLCLVMRADGGPLEISVRGLRI
jgi:hypothetical protein